MEEKHHLCISRRIMSEKWLIPYICPGCRADYGARATAAVCNKLHPLLIGTNMLTIYPDSGLYQEIRQGKWKEESETEKYREVRVLVEGLEIPTEFRIYERQPQHYGLPLHMRRSAISAGRPGGFMFLEEKVEFRLL